MIIFGHPWIKSSHFCKVFSVEDMMQTKAEDIVLLEPLVDSHSLATYCQENHIPYGVVVSTLEDAILANAMGASYIVCEEDAAFMIQPIAENYLFDAKVLVLIHDTKSISKIARGGIDGAVFTEAIS
ncbi:MAG: hypothetical protein IE885_06385 [Campylobacterales bacterium]|nr:hypothetical protein [Campylobacterales bacterium]